MPLPPTPTQPQNNLQGDASSPPRRNVATFKGLIEDPRFAPLPWEKKQIALERFTTKNPHPLSPALIELQRLKHYSEDGTPASKKFHSSIYSARRDWFKRVAEGRESSGREADFNYDRALRSAQEEYEADLDTRQRHLSMARRFIEITDRRKSTFANEAAYAFEVVNPFDNQELKDTERSNDLQERKNLLEQFGQEGFDNDTFKVLLDDARLSTGLTGVPAAVDSQGAVIVNDNKLVLDIDDVRKGIEDLSGPEQEKARAIATLEARRKKIVDDVFQVIALTGGLTWDQDPENELNRINPRLRPINTLGELFRRAGSRTAELLGKDDTESEQSARASLEARDAGGLFGYNWKDDQKLEAVQELARHRDGYIDRALIGAGQGLGSDIFNMVATPLEMLGSETAKELAAFNNTINEAARFADSNIVELTTSHEYTDLASRIIPQVLLTRKVGNVGGAAAASRGAAQATQARVAGYFATGYGGYQSAVFNARDVLDNGGTTGEALGAGILGFGTTFLIANGFNKIGAGGVESFRAKAASASTAAKRQLSSRLGNIAIQGLGEGVEEFVDEFINGLYTQDFTGATPEQLASNAFKAGVIGFGIGGTVGGFQGPSVAATGQTDAQASAAADAAMAQLQGQGATEGGDQARVAARINELREKSDAAETIEQPDGTVLETGLTEEETVELENLEAQLRGEASPIESTEGGTATTEGSTNTQPPTTAETVAEPAADTETTEDALPEGVRQLSETKYEVDTLSGKSTIEISDPVAARNEAIKLAEQVEATRAQQAAEQNTPPTEAVPNEQTAETNQAEEVADQSNSVENLSYRELQREAENINREIQTNLQSGNNPALIDSRKIRLNASAAKLREFITENRPKLLKKQEQSEPEVQAQPPGPVDVPPETVEEPTVEEDVDQDLEAARDEVFDQLNDHDPNLSEEQAANFDERISKATTVEELTALGTELVDTALATTAPESDAPVEANDPVSVFLRSATKFQKDEFIRRFAYEGEDALDVIADLTSDESVSELLTDEEILEGLFDGNTETEPARRSAQDKVETAAIEQAQDQEPSPALDETQPDTDTTPNQQLEEQLDNWLEEELDDSTKAAVAAELVEDGWGAPARSEFVKRFTDWLVNGASNLSNRIVNLFKSLATRLRTAGIVGFVAVSMLNPTGYNADSVISVPRAVAETNTAVGPVTPPTSIDPSTVDVGTPADAGVGVTLPPAGPVELTIDSDNTIALSSNPVTDISNEVKVAGEVDFNGVTTSIGTTIFADWVVRNNDHEGKPFAIADKKNGSLAIFDGNGKLLRKVPALFGIAIGDQLPADRTGIPRNQLKITPAGRFGNTNVVPSTDPNYSPAWLDFAQLGPNWMVAIHKTYLKNPAEQRQQRLDSTTAADNRISAGCINCDQSDSIFTNELMGEGGIVYVMPETEQGRSTFRGFEDSQVPIGDANTDNSGTPRAVPDSEQQTEPQADPQRVAVSKAGVNLPSILLALSALGGRLRGKRRKSSDDTDDAATFDADEAATQAELDEILERNSPTPAENTNSRMRVPRLLPAWIIDDFARDKTGSQNTFIPGIGKAIQYLSLGITKQIHNDLVGTFFGTPVKSWLFGQESAKRRGLYLERQFQEIYPTELATDSDGNMTSPKARVEGTSLRFSDVMESVMEHGDRDYEISDEFKNMVADWKYVLNRILKDAIEEGIPMGFLTGKDGKVDLKLLKKNFYAPRGRVSLVNNPEDSRTFTGAGRPRANVRSLTTKRKFSSEQEAIKTGEYKYDDPPAKRIGDLVTDIYSRIEDRRLANSPALVANSERSRFETDEKGRRRKVRSLGTNTATIAGKAYNFGSANVQKLNSIIDGRTLDPTSSLSRVAAVFQGVRSTKFSVDWSAAAIQLAYLWGYSPPRAAKAITIALGRTFGVKSWLRNYNLKNRDLIAERISVGSLFSMSLGDIDFLNETDSSSSGIRQLLAKGLQPFSNFHTIATEVGTNELYAALRYQALDKKTGRLDPIKAEKIARFTDRSAGRESLSRNGVPALDRTFLSTISAAPGMYGAFVNMMADIVSKDSFTRKQAIKAHGRFIVGMSMLYLAKTFAAMMLDDEDERSPEAKFNDAISRLHPKSKKFMTTEVPIGDGRRVVFSEGGFFKSATQLSARIIADPGNSGEYISRFLKSKKSPGVGTALEMLTKKDYFGNEITTLEALADAYVPITLNELARQHRGPVIDLVAGWLTAVTPFDWKGQSSTAMLDEKPHLSQTLEQMIFNSVGLSAYTESSRGEFNRQMDMISGTMFEGKAYRDLDGGQKAEVTEEAAGRGIFKPKFKTMDSYSQFQIDRLTQRLSDAKTRKALFDRNIYAKVAAIPQYSSVVDGTKIHVESTDHREMYRNFTDGLKELTRREDIESLDSSRFLMEADALWRRQLREYGY